ncbi:MAG: transcription antitermination factor NusB [Alphaproteobacteria bacterium]|nr:transcription antitermination factor NusB [Alphaproteobacteria bacterium]
MTSNTHKTPKPKPKSKGKQPAQAARSAARVGAVQALYQMDVGGADVTDVIAEFTTLRFPNSEAGETIAGADPAFFAELLRGVVRRQRDLDPLIDQQLAIGWRLVRIDSILRAILRSGAFEMMERLDVPARVVINEYIDVAHAFFDEEEPKVVNGVLDRLAHRLRPAEFEGKGDHGKGERREKT